MEFVGGYPNEYCIFLKNLTETELEQITSLDGTHRYDRRTAASNRKGQTLWRQDKKIMPPLAGSPRSSDTPSAGAWALGGLHRPIWRLAGRPLIGGADWNTAPLSRTGDLDGLVG